MAVDDGGAIAGFATVAASELVPEKAPAGKRRKLPQYPLPVLRLARLAVDERFRRKRVGSLLLRAVFVVAAQMTEDVGCTGVVVDAKPEAVAF